MKLIIFAGGAGTRLWPISRRRTPKQFEKLKSDRSTLQMACDRVKEFGRDNIYISTNQDYEQLILDQLPDFKKDNILFEPARRDLAPAVGLALMRLKKQGFSGTVTLLWSDHFVDYPDRFTAALKRARSLVEDDPDKIVFLAEKPRFANENLGWIKVGAELESDIHAFEGWKYRPDLVLCEKMLASGSWLWNPGYFVFNIDFVLSLYEKHVPQTHAKLTQIIADESKLEQIYPQLEPLHFDKAILEKIEASEALVLKVNLGWSDPGTLYALKETLQPDPEKNFYRGKVVSRQDKDCLIYSEEDEKLVATAGLEGIMVVNTKDVLFVCHKDEITNIKKMLKKIERQGMDHYL